MNIHLLSDLHLEFEGYVPDPDTVGRADVIVLAGDLHVGARGIEWALRVFPDKPVIYVLGNHEYYRHIHPKLARDMKALAEGTQMHVLENESWALGEVTFHGATMWTDFELFGDPRFAGFECQQRMNDYRKIRREPSYSKLRSIDVATIHARSRHWLQGSVAASTTRFNVVVSHHAPSTLSVPEEYRDDLLTAAYASNLEPVIDRLKPDLWLHGHIHSTSDYRVGNTRVLCNPRGYLGERNPAFAPGLMISLPG